MKKLPRLTRRDQVEIRGVYGQPVFDIYQQARAILERAAPDRRLSNFFAEPQLNPARGEIAWYSAATGEVKSLGQLDAQNRAALLDSVDVIRQQIRAAGERFAAEGGGASGTRAEIFKAMLSATNLDHCLYMVGSQPVLCEWGCKPLGQGAGDVDLWSYGSALRSAADPVDNAAQAAGAKVEPTDIKIPELVEIQTERTAEPAVSPNTPLDPPPVAVKPVAAPRPTEPLSRQLPEQTRPTVNEFTPASHQHVAKSPRPAVAPAVSNADWAPSTNQGFGLWNFLKRIIVALLVFWMVLLLMRGCSDTVVSPSAHSEETQLRQDIAALRSEASKVLAACPLK